MIADPLIYGARPALREPTTVRTIRRNAGRMHPNQLAHALGWSRWRLDEVARREGIDLTYPRVAKHEPEPRGA